MIASCGCDGHRPTVADCAIVAVAAVAGLALTGLVAAVSLVWRATDVELPDVDELTGTLGLLVALSTGGGVATGEGAASSPAKVSRG